jgi:hypothetical protein
MAFKLSEMGGLYFLELVYKICPGDSCIEMNGRVNQKLAVISESFHANCCDGKVEFSYQFARFMESQMYDLVDSGRSSPLVFVIWKSAIVILSDGTVMTSVVKVSPCTILATCHGAPRKFTQKVSIGESASP